MIVSFKWLNEYVPLAGVSADELARRLMLAGLNHEETVARGDDLAIDLEVTSNRPDCLGHIGVAREGAVLLGLPLTLPPASPPETGPPVGGLARVEIRCPALCPRYTARVIRGVKVGPSPAWLAARLTTVGIAPINNVVDVTNYVLLECGQPLHAFDLAKLAGREIIVREAQPREPFAAINHKQYELDAGMCVIADRGRAVALGGVMGGADSEVSLATTELLIESAEFDPRTIRNAARRLNLHSDSSYRFERGVDPEGVDWASRRACELIMQLAGGELAAGAIDVGRSPGPRLPIVLRLSQIPRILGIGIDPAEVRRILAALGNREVRADAATVEVVPPSWRRDLTREIDLIEEVARIHGYEAIPEDVSVPMASSSRGESDRVAAKVREVLVSAGVDEAMTLSVVEPPLSEAFTPWTDAAALELSAPILRRADRLRRSLIPSLLAARRTNETLANARCELFETARIYLPQPGALRGSEKMGTGTSRQPDLPGVTPSGSEPVSIFSQPLPREELMLALVSGRDFLAVKGVLEAVLERLNPAAELEMAPFKHGLFAPGRACELRIGGERFGFLGEISAEGRKQFELRQPATVAEVRMGLLEQIARLVPQAVELSPYPPVERDLNLVVAEPVRWGEISATVRAAAGPSLERLDYQDTYRDPERLGAGKKSFLLTLTLRRSDRTLASVEAEEICAAVVKACASAHGAELRA